MGKYSKFERQHVSEMPWKIHPIWRGIGCVLLLIIPLMAYAGADLLLENGVIQSYIYLPFELTNPAYVLGFGPWNHLYGNLLVALLLSLIGFGFVTMLYAVLYRIMRPRGYNIMDAPASEFRTRKKRK